MRIEKTPDRIGVGEREPVPLSAKLVELLLKPPLALAFVMFRGRGVPVGLGGRVLDLKTDGTVEDGPKPAALRSSTALQLAEVPETCDWYCAWISGESLQIS